MRRQRNAGKREENPDDPKEFEEFVAGSMRSLMRTAVVITWSLADAEDVVQEALFRMARHWPRMRAMAHPYAYARQVVVRQALRGAERRATQRSELTGLPQGVVEAGAASDDFSGVDLRLELAQLLGALAPRQRAVLVLRYAEQMTEAEVAELLACPIGTVKSSAARALERLRSRDDQPRRPSSGTRSDRQTGRLPAGPERPTNTDARSR